MSLDGLRGGQEDDLSGGVQQGGAHGPALVALRLGLKRFRDEFEGEGVKTFVHIDDVSFGLIGATDTMVRAVSFLRQVLAAIGTVVNPAKPVVLPPRGHTVTTEETLLPLNTV